MKNLSVLLIWLLLTCCVSLAQDDKTTGADTSDTKMKLLQKFVGKWTTKSKSISADGIAPNAYTGTMESRMLGKLWLINEYDAVIGGMQFNALQRLGYDAQKKKYTGTWADSFMTYQWPLEGKADGNQLVVNSKGPNPAKPGTTADFRDIYEFKSADLILSTSEMRAPDGKWNTFMTSEFRRDKAPVESTQKTRIVPFLMFDGQAEEAMTLYTKLFPDASIESIEKYGAGEAGREGSVKQAMFKVAGQRVMCIDSPAKHEFTFTASFSFFVKCESKAQIDQLFAELSKDGQIMMPIDNYGFSERFGWVSDRFGVSWQLDLSEE